LAIMVPVPSLKASFYPLYYPKIADRLVKSELCKQHFRWDLTNEIWGKKHFRNWEQKRPSRPHGDYFPTYETERTSYPIKLYYHRYIKTLWSHSCYPNPLSHHFRTCPPLTTFWHLTLLFDQYH
jgi:hypothetical protein